jgi:predicted outer membrane repeat protein
MKTDLNSLCVVVALLIHSAGVFAADRSVPAPYPTIQAAINAAVDGDTVTVAPDTYYETIDVGGKSITIASSDPNDPNVVAGTIIDANGSGTVVTFPDAASANCALVGFTITNGNSAGNGGGISCWNGAITIKNCIITGNDAASGGGIYNEEADLTLAGCTFSGNSADFYGGGIHNDDGVLTLAGCTFSENMALGLHGGGLNSAYGELTMTGCTFTSNSAGDEGGGVAADRTSVTMTNCTFTSNSATVGGGIHNAHWGATMTNCTFSSNSATDDGGGVHTNYLYLDDFTPLRLTNCTFSGNVADDLGGAVHNRAGGTMILTNCILWGNTALWGPQIAMDDEGAVGTVSISYCCLQGLEWDIHAPSADVDLLDGTIIDTDPCFTDQPGGDYHLRSAAGRWDPNVNGWVADDGNSLCIDTGDPNSDWAAELWPHGKRINMGAFGGTPQASMSGSDAGNIADLDHSGLVDGIDLKLLTDKWLYRQLLLSEDLDRDGFLDAKDFAVLTDNWRWEQ